MAPKNTPKILGPIETNIVARLTYEKKAIVTVEDLDRLFNLSPEDRKQIVFRLKKKKRGKAFYFIPSKDIHRKLRHLKKKR